MKKVLYIFGRLSDDDTEWLIDNGHKKKFEAGSDLVQEGEHLQNLYIVISGNLALSIGQKKKILAELETGEIVGDMSFVDSSPSPITVTAIRDTYVYAIELEHLEQKIRQDTGFASRFYHAIALFLASRLRSTLGLYEYDDVDDVEGIHRPDEELDDMIMDTITLGGDRFHRMLTRMLKR